VEAIMKCPFLVVPVAATCVAEKKVVWPSSKQLEAYCTRGYHKKCPIFRTAMKKGYEKMRNMGTEYKDA
jgi:hypothetical protein